MTCPKCHFEQEGGEECLRCGIIFKKYRPLPPPSQRKTVGQPSTQTKPPTGEPPLGLQHTTEAGDIPAPPQAEEPEDLVLEIDEERPRRGALRVVFRIFPWVSLAAALGVFYLVFQQAPPLEIHVDPGAMERVGRKMEELQVAAQMGLPYTLSLDEAELNAWLHANLASASGESPVGVTGYAPPMHIPADDPKFQEAQSAMKDLRVNLSGDTLRAYAVFDFHGRNLSLLLEGRIRIQDGYLRLEPTDAKIGSLPIPKVTLDGVVNRLFDSPQNRDAFRLSPQISTVDIRHGKLFVAFR